MRQVDVKALIAYRSVTHIGLVIMASLGGSVWGYYGALVGIVAHGLVSSFLFVLANLGYRVFSSRRLFLTKGVISFCPLLRFFWFLALGANMGMPPSLNLVREVMMVVGISYLSYMILLPVGIRLFLSAAYRLYLFVRVQYGDVARVRGGISVRAIGCCFFHLVPIFCGFLLIGGC